ncbi:MAG: hypothetical protein JRI59_02315 [Deltaproteobacteria bacterium]|nr:hypothetical protein [Deltaproteobacteria bacterium]
MKKLAIVLAVMLALVLAAGAVLAADQMPSSKVAVALGQINVLKEVSSEGSPGSSDSGWETILRTYIKTPNQKELLFHVSLESGIYTQTKVKSKRNSEGDTSTDTSSASGIIRVRVRVIDPNGYVRYAAPSGNSGRSLPIGGTEGVVFNYRTQTMTAKFMGIFTGECLIVDPDTDEVTIDYNCLEPEELELLLDTLEANAFNFLLANVVPGVQTIEVQARLEVSADSQDGSSEAKAAIGLGSLVVETVRMVKGEDGTPELQ